MVGGGLPQRRVFCGQRNLLAAPLHGSWLVSLANLGSIVLLLTIKVTSYPVSLSQGVSSSTRIQVEVVQKVD